jgi:hypothetical protein
VPGGDMVIHIIDHSAVQVEEEGFIFFTCHAAKIKNFGRSWESS